MRVRKSVILRKEREKISETVAIIRRLYWIEGGKVHPAGHIERPSVEELKKATQNLRDVLNECTLFRGKVQGIEQDRPVLKREGL